MATIKNNTSNSIWVLCDDGDTIWHLSEVPPSCECTSSQLNQRQFKTESEAIAEIPEQYRDE